MKKMEEYTGVKKIIRILGAILFTVGIVALLVYDYHDVPKYTYINLGRGSRDMTKELSEGVVITQEIPYYAGDWGLSFIFTNFGHRVFGDLIVRAVGQDSGFVYIDRTVPGKEIRNNEYIDFLFPKKITASDKTLMVSFTASCAPGSGLALMTTGEDSLPEVMMSVDGEESESDLMVRRVITRSFAEIILMIAAVLALISVVILKWKGNSLPMAYTVLAMSLGILFMLIMTPFAIPDEQFHYHSAFYLSNLILSRDPEVGEAQYFDYSGFSEHHNVRTGYARVLDDFFKVSDSDGTRKLRQYSLPYPLMYLPQAAGITLGRLLQLNFVMTFYLGRFCNLLFFVTCVYLAIRKAPRFKLLIFMVGLMPMALHQAASYSYDTFINGLSFLFIALILKLADGESRIGFTEFLPAILTGALLCPAKPVYAPFMLLFLLIPIKRFSSFRKSFLLLAGIFVLAGMVVMITRKENILELLSAPNTTASLVEEDSAFEKLDWSKKYKLPFILSHPIRTIQIFFDTLRYDEYWFNWILQAVGRRMAGFNLLVDEWHIFAYLILLIISAFTNDNQMSAIRVADRVLLLFISASVIVAVMLVMFVGWTPYGAGTIMGIQGRYFIPVLPLLLMCCNNSLIMIRGSIEKRMIAFGLFINLSILNQILLLTMK